MAENHDTQTLAPEKPTTQKKSKPEKLATWLFTTSKNCRPLLGFALVGAIGYISLRFNYELGKLSAVDDVSQQLLPVGYAMLDICALFLSGLIGLKARSTWRKACAWGWFLFLVSLSLWAAASFTLSIDSRLANKDLTHAIEQQEIVVESVNQEVEIWRQNVAEAVNFKTKHQNTLNQIQARQVEASNKLHELESQQVAPAMAIYNKTAPLVGISSETLNLIMRLLWSAALTLSPLVLGLLGWATWEESKPDDKPRKKEPAPSTVSSNSASWKDSFTTWNNRRKVRNFLKKHTRPAVATASTEGRETPPQVRNNSRSVGIFPAPQLVKTGSNISPINNHNQHTKAADMNGVRYATEWLNSQEVGRIKRENLAFACKVKSREGVNKIIQSLLDQGLLSRHNNGQLYKPENSSNQEIQRSLARN